MQDRHQLLVELAELAELADTYYVPVVDSRRHKVAVDNLAAVVLHSLGIVAVIHKVDFVGKVAVVLHSLDIVVVIHKEDFVVGRRKVDIVRRSLKINFVNISILCEKLEKYQ